MFSAGLNEDLLKVCPSAVMINLYQHSKFDDSTDRIKLVALYIRLWLDKGATPRRAADIQDMLFWLSTKVCVKGLK